MNAGLVTVRCVLNRNGEDEEVGGASLSWGSDGGDFTIGGVGDDYCLHVVDDDVDCEYDLGTDCTLDCPDEP